MSNEKAYMETIVEFMEDLGDGSGIHHTLYFCDDSGTFIRESVGVDFHEGVELEDFNDQQALEWCVEFVGMDYVEAARRIIGADQDTPR